MSNKKKLIVFPVNGLCNRIMGIAGGMVLADMFNLNLITHWLPGKEDCNAEFSDLFDDTKLNVHTKETIPSNNFEIISTISNDRLSSLANIYNSPNIYKSTNFYEICELITRFTNNDQDIVLISHTKIPHGTECDYYIKNFLKYITLKKDITKSIQNYESKISKFSDALHLRLTDNLNEDEENVTNYMNNIIDKLKEKNVKVVIFTDDPKKGEYLLSKIPDSIIIPSNTGRDSKAIQDALRDLILMSKFETIYIAKTKYTSSFSNVANIIGKNKLIKL